MKKLVIIFAIALATFSIGCEPEDLTSNEPQEQATGKDCDGSAGDKEGCDQ